MKEPENLPEQDRDSTEVFNSLLHVSLTSFDGPLDLLLHLVRKHELDIQDLKLAELTEPYLEYLQRMEALNLDVAGEFLSIASTLVWIKSKSLLPRDFEGEELEPVDEEALLIERLREYQKIKEAALQLAGLDLTGRDRFSRQVSRLAEESLAEDEEPPGIEGVSLFQLIEAFRDVLERAKETPAMEIVPEQERIEDKIEELLARFLDEKTVAFYELFDLQLGRRGIILVFIALLELVRIKAIRILQTHPLGEIMCQAAGNIAESAEAWKAAVMDAIGEQKQPHPSPRPVEEGAG